MRAPLPTQWRTWASPANGNPSPSSMVSMASARSGTLSTRVPSRSNRISAGNWPSNRSRKACILNGARQGQLLAHGANRGLIIRCVEDGGTGHEGIRTGLGNLADVIDVHAAIDFQPDRPATGADLRPRFPPLADGPGYDFLLSEARAPRHQQPH